MFKTYFITVTVCGTEQVLGFIHMHRSGWSGSAHLCTTRTKDALRILEDNQCGRVP